MADLVSDSDSPEANETLPGKKGKKKNQNMKWYLVGGLGVIAVLVFFFVSRSKSNATTEQQGSETTSGSGLDPNTLAALQEMGLLGDSSDASSSYGDGSSDGTGGYWGGGGGWSHDGSSSTGTTSTTTGTTTTASSGGQLSTKTSGSQTLSQLAASLGTTTQSLIADTMTGHGNINNGQFDNWLKKTSMGTTGKVPAGLTLYYTPSGKG